ncbi:glutathione-disulfide reductase [Hahella sp. SMD15-11]|uniref:Glutathione-disulfide reductase n=1 Tax=Thermohahella caldifontis TaxID=3142973 RepID=A0AB39UXX7_9GAMM
MSDSYDLIVLGGGSGGVRAARIAASLGARVAIVEGCFWGGTCVNVGCVPKKLYVYASHYHQSFEEAEGFGWKAGQISHDWAILQARQRAEIQRLNGIYSRLLDHSGVTRIEGYGRFLDAHTIEVNGERLTGRYILVATGSTPEYPDIPGKEWLQCSDRLFELKEKPGRAVVWGGGYIAVEFACILAGLGVETTLVYRGSQILRKFDPDVSAFVQSELPKKGIWLKLDTTLESLERVDDGVRAQLSNGESLIADEVFGATGRRPNTDQLNLEAAGVMTGPKGEVIVDENYQTSQAHIFAVGDVIDRVQLTPVALAEGMYVANRLFGGIPKPVRYDLIPTAVFSQPAIGTVGMTEPEAREAGHEVRIYMTDFKPLKHTLSDMDERTLVKLIVDAETDRVLGAHMVGDEAADVIQGIAIAMTAGATKSDFDSTIGIHPSSAEEFVTLRTPVR